MTNSVFRFGSVLAFFQVLFCFGAVVSQAAPQLAKTYSTKVYSTKHAKGFVRNAKTLEFFRNTPHQSFTEADGPVPGSYSMRFKAGPVENQGQCGSCWDFALTTTLRGTYIMNGHDTGKLSFNYLLNCAKDQQGCDGGDFNAAEWLIHPKGAPEHGADGWYQAASGQCEERPVVGSARAYHMLGANGSQPSFRDIAYVVGVLHRPVSVDAAVDGNWEMYLRGTYNACTDEYDADINHMIVIEGYDCEGHVDSHGNCLFDENGNLPPNVGTWWVRNSWGDQWGDGGYIKTKATDVFGTRCNEIGHDALYFDLE